jgi:hypothetical protein
MLALPPFVYDMPGVFTPEEAEELLDQALSGKNMTVSVKSSFRDCSG